MSDKHRMTLLSFLRQAERGLSTDRLRSLRAARTVARLWSRDWLTRRLIPSLPRNAIVPLDAASDVLLQCSWSPWEFTPQAYAQECAFAHELAARGRSFAVTDQPELIFGKSVMWFLPNEFILPRVWDYSRQVREFATSLEQQGNRLFCSAEETAFWENKVHMHQRLEDVDAPTPETRIVTSENWQSVPFDIEPVLIKEEHSASSAGVYHFSTSHEAREFVAKYQFRPAESLIMQEVVRGATRDLRLTLVGDRSIESATYWRTKSREALSRSEWTTTATTYNSLVDHSNIPESVVPFAAHYMHQLGVRTAGVDLMWVDDDVSRDPVILEFSPYYQPNPPKPVKYDNLSYKEFKTDWAAKDGYLARQYLVFRDIASQILNQGLFSNINNVETGSNIAITDRETDMLQTLREIKAQSGSHAPSLYAIGDRIPDLEIKVDACFLSNPYATDLFIERLTADLLETGDLRKVLESYPSPNNHVATMLERTINVNREQIFVCNGAVEAIQAALHRFAGTRVAVILPTFSPYYEYLRPDQDCFFYKLSRDNDFALDIDDFADFVRKNRIDTVCLINPNNPNGGYVPAEAMHGLLNKLEDLQLVILDKSFVDFAYEDDSLNRRSLASEVAQIPNVMLVKSMSKDFGVAGLRAGYAVMSPDRVNTLLTNGYLWNISGLAEFFFRLFAESEFQDQYVAARLRYLDEAIPFFAELKKVDCLQTYSTKANFCLVQLDKSVQIEMLVPLLLIRHGIYVRDCRDKIGLEDGQYIRVASRKGFENEMIIQALTDLIPKCRENF